MLLNSVNDTRLKYDKGSYQEELVRSIYPGVYSLATPHNDCNECNGYNHMMRWTIKAPIKVAKRSKMAMLNILGSRSLAIDII